MSPKSGQSLFIISLEDFWFQEISVVFRSVSININQQKSQEKILSSQNGDSFHRSLYYSVGLLYLQSLIGVYHSGCCGNSNLEFPDFSLFKTST